MFPAHMHRTKSSYGQLRLAEGLAVLDLLETVFLETNGIDLDKAGGIHGREALEAVHGGIGLRIQVAGVTGATEDVRRALVDEHADLTSDILLGEDDGVLDELALRAEVHAVVDCRSC